MSSFGGDLGRGKEKAGDLKGIQSLCDL